MKAQFIGTDGSMGLKQGEVYDVKAIININYPIMLEIKGNDGKSYNRCPYDSFQALFNNWLFIHGKFPSY